tara:strand:+ start:121 stop:1377 length:1257 start_codon:yes stop_codon:yes gene_type:complete
MTPEEMQAEMDRLQASGVFAGTQASQAQSSVNNMNAQMQGLQSSGAFKGAPPPPAKPPPGLLSRMGTGINNFRQDPEKMARLTMGLNAMRLNPDQGIAASAANTIEQAQARKQTSLDAAGTIKFLQGRSASDPMAAQALAAIQANPSMVKDIMGAYLSGQFKSPHMSKNIGSIQTAQEDLVENGVVIVKKGGQYTYNQNPNSETGQQYTIIPLSGSGITEAQKNENILAQQKAEWDMTQGLKKGEEVFKQFSLIDRQIEDFKRVGQLVDEGAKTGFIQKFVPSSDAATSELRNITNKMGIDIINSATFGALSATELRLALETGFDPNLSGDQLVLYIQNKIAAQTKLRNALMPEIQMLLGGSGLKSYADYKIENRKRHDAAQDAFSALKKINPSLTALEYRDYNLEDREELMREGGLL